MVGIGTYPIFELELLEQWLETKVRTLDAKTSSDDPLEYSEANLTKAILKFVKFMVMEQKDKQTDCALRAYDYGLPYYSPPNPSCTSTYVKTTTNTSDDSATETICPTCRTQAPGATHCVHRTVYKQS